jgi:decaprenylphospho-beta-D-ribofuranose 2-oxidase
VSRSAGFSVSRSSLTGWGRTNPSVAGVVEVLKSDVAAVVKEAGPRGALVRGLGRSYGDAAQNGGGIVLRLAGSASDAYLDTTARTVTVSGGATLDELLRIIVRRGFFVPVTPGTRSVTVGGAIASDIHGKGHHVEGSFGNHVVRMAVQLADGSVADVSRSNDPELFWATIGGMGLTGVILDATIHLLPIESSRMSVDTSRVADLDALFEVMSVDDDRHRYSAAWIDLVAKGRHLGRSVLTRGDHARVDQLDARAQATPFDYDPRQLATVPPIVPRPGFLNHATVAAFNEFWFRKAPRHRVGELQTIAGFFHPLDMIGAWNRLYGRPGLVQYQFVVPFGEEDTMRRVVERLAVSGAASFLAVLKRFGAANDAHLSFPRPGWTLALDMPGGSKGLAQLLHGLDEMILAVGGRNYFAKDAHTTPSVIRRGYPRLAEWQAVQARVDPTGVWQSDLSRRLELTSSAASPQPHH